MTFEELRRKLGAVYLAGPNAPGYFNFPPMTLSRLRELAGEPVEQKINEVGVAYIGYHVDGGAATIIARAVGPTQRLEGGIMFVHPDDDAASHTRES